MPDDLRVEIVKAGSEPYQNRDGPFVDTVQRSGDKIKGKSRHFQALPNGEKVLRKWMVYSPIKKVYTVFAANCSRTMKQNRVSSTALIHGGN